MYDCYRVGAVFNGPMGWTLPALSSSWIPIFNIYIYIYIYQALAVFVKDGQCVGAVPSLGFWALGLRGWAVGRCSSEL